MPTDTRYMLISKSQNRYAAIDAEKVGAGRFLTTSDSWLYPQVKAFLCAERRAEIVDPFVGEGDMLRHARGAIGAREEIGYDIRPGDFGAPNDSLLLIPRHPDGVIVTNPPYLAKHSAKRKRVWDDVAHYYTGGRSDLYQVALDRCLDACDRVVAIIPETFLNSSYPKNQLAHVTIVQRRLFSDTDCPVCIACFDGRSKPLAQIEVFCDEELLGALQDFENARLIPTKRLAVRFNDPHGVIALRAVDLPDPSKPIEFMPRNECDYPVDMIKVSSRLVTFISLPSVEPTRYSEVIDVANRILNAFRETTCDVVLSPFKGNSKNGRRRRRLDYSTARAILEQAVAETAAGAAEPACSEECLFTQEER